ncbi:hypothetical protein [Nostoc sp. CENA543]|uniref:hypothetical protein n=1 Tax=Nostoc sp. CENA543 TaxID=1869241 RepID=UPI0018641975|nr:hypothetical protein [Nostoc sp. CENA543]
MLTINAKIAIAVVCYVVTYFQRGRAINCCSIVTLDACRAIAVYDACVVIYRV